MEFEIKKDKIAKSAETLNLSPSKSLFQKWGGWILFSLAFLLYANTLGHQFAFDARKWPGLSARTSFKIGDQGVFVAIFLLERKH